MHAIMNRVAIYLRLLLVLFIVMLVLPPLLLNGHDPAAFILAFEVDQIVRIYLQKRQRVQRMALEQLARVTFDDFLWIRCDGKHMHTILGQRNEVFVLLDH